MLFWSFFPRSLLCFIFFLCSAVLFLYCWFIHMLIFFFSPFPLCVHVHFSDNLDVCISAHPWWVCLTCACLQR